MPPEKSGVPIAVYTRAQQNEIPWGQFDKIGVSGVVHKSDSPDDDGHSVIDVIS